MSKYFENLRVNPNSQIRYTERKEGDRIIKEVVERKKDEIIKKIINRSPEFKSLHSKIITYGSRDNNKVRKISSIECVNTEDGYITENRFLIIKCPYDTETSIVIIFSPYRIPQEQPKLAGVITFSCEDPENIPKCTTDYDIISRIQDYPNKNDVIQGLGYQPFYDKNSIQNKWAMGMLDKIQAEYRSNFELEER